MYFSLQRYKVKQSLVNFRAYLELEPPIASQKFTKSPLLTCVPTSDMTTIWLWLITSCHKKWYVMSWKRVPQYHLMPRELWVADITQSLLCREGGNKLMTKVVIVWNQTYLPTRCLELAGMKFAIVPYFTTFVFVIRYSGKLLSYKCYRN